MVNMDIVDMDDSDNKNNNNEDNGNEDNENDTSKCVSRLPDHFGDTSGLANHSAMKLTDKKIKTMTTLLNNEDNSIMNTMTVKTATGSDMPSTTPPHGQAKTTLAPSESAAASSCLRVVFTGTQGGARHVISCIHAHPAGDNDLIPAKPQSCCHVLLPVYANTYDQALALSSFRR